jgi:predicted transcriptional regulator
MDRNPGVHSDSGQDIASVGVEGYLAASGGHGGGQTAGIAPGWLWVYPDCRGYTKGMKTAISLPDDVFEGAERLARRTKKSRSQLFSDAVQEYVARHAPEHVTDAMDRVCADLGEPVDKFVSAASHRVLERSEW